MTLAPNGAAPTAAREGEVPLAFDPASLAADAGLVFIGRINSPWKTRADCPRNTREARERGAQPATVAIDAPYRAGLSGLAGGSHVFLLTWLHGAQRNLIIQKPRHASVAKGVFALRSPVRPNPIGLHAVRLLALDAEAGFLTVDAIDVLDGTPVIDVKPYFPSVDAFPEAAPPETR